MILATNIIDQANSKKVYLINKNRFLWGNIKPDCASKYKFKKHYYDESIEMILDGVSNSENKESFLVIGKHETKFGEYLKDKFQNISNIKFLGAIYDINKLNDLRKYSNLYFHGHTVGGTNPSLIEALGSTDLNLLVDVGFNKEVAENCALYWSRRPGSLAKLIDKADQMSEDEIAEMGRRAKKRVAEEYTWNKICGQYEDVFTKY